jgi:peroxiredoxin
MVGIGGLEMEQEQKETTHSEPGHTIEAFSLIDANGIPTNLEQISGEKGVVIGFLHGTYCPACMFQLTRSNRLADKLKKRRR